MKKRFLKGVSTCLLTVFVAAAAVFAEPASMTALAAGNGTTVTAAQQAASQTAAVTAQQATVQQTAAQTAAQQQAAVTALYASYAGYNNNQLAYKRGLLQRYQGKTLSILGDSISTYAGTQPQDYIVYYPQGDITSAGLTWWGQVASACGMTLLRNASWSGARMSGSHTDETGKTGCSSKRASDLAGKDAVPDVIFIMMGANDYFSSIGIYGFENDYNYCLDSLRAKYPFAQIVCFGTTPVFYNPNGNQAENEAGYTLADYNAAAARAAAAHGLEFVDTSAAGLNSSMMIDGIHPNFTGAGLMARYILSVM